ncbi:3942_t:CDS:2 [Paraglomus brasilianum]|uniref:3942_t:CDS:1 n=1 Tax=Paraglomus brasilianum TaxID=144538 RepID=A0A9N9AKR0_9GLOM|nr:3942_t:CDS:2 [Paraglomus brasilianum]
MTKPNIFSKIRTTSESENKNDRNDNGSGIPEERKITKNRDRVIPTTPTSPDVTAQNIHSRRIYSSDINPHPAYSSPKINPLQSHPPILRQNSLPTFTTSNSSTTNNSAEKMFLKFYREAESISDINQRCTFLLNQCQNLSEKVSKYASTLKIYQGQVDIFEKAAEAKERDHKLKMSKEQEKRLKFEKELQTSKALLDTLHQNTTSVIKWSDSDPNNSVYISRALESLLEPLLEIGHTKRHVDINQAQAAELLKMYNCKMKVGEQGFKVVLSCALQRLVVESVLSFMSTWLGHVGYPQKESVNGKVSKIVAEWVRRVEQSGVGNTNEIYGTANPDSQEFEIVKHSNYLLTIMENFKNKSDAKGIHEQTRVLIRQQVSSLLGQHAFAPSSQTVSGQPRPHPFILFLTSEIISLVSTYVSYRSFTSRTSFPYSHPLYPTVVSFLQSLISVMHFQLATQDPVPQWRFYEAGDRKKQKKGGLEVEICWFPIVALNTDIVKKPDQNRSIYCKARVWARKSGLDDGK